MARFAIVALMPEKVPGRADFVSREFDVPEDFAGLIAELEERAPGWRMLTVCHIEDLPLLMEPPGGAPNDGPVE